MRVLFIEDSERLRVSVTTGLRKEGFAVDTAGDGDEGLYLAEVNRYDVIILDLMLPGLDGLTILRRLREQGSDVHILILTARSAIEERVEGLRLGADDYLTKPFSFDELTARVQALIRREYRMKSPVIRVGGIEINTATKTVLRNGERIPLPPREYRLLEFLARRKGRVVTRTEIEEHIYDERVSPMSNVVDSAICNLRRMINVKGQPDIIHTKRGLGYILSDGDR